MSKYSSIAINEKTMFVLEAGDTEELTEFNKIFALSNYSINNTSIVRIGVINDGSSLLHAISQSCFKVYSEGMLKDGTGYIKTLDKREFIKSLREELANKLNYEKKYQELIELDNYVTPEIIDDVLRSNYNLDDRFHKYISTVLRVNLYIIDTELNSKIYNNDKNEKNIIIYSMPNHYELIGYRYNHVIKNCFKDNHPLIKFLNDR